MSRITRNFSIIYRTERLIARRRMAVLRHQTGLMLFAGLVAGVGVIMLNVAAYLGLSARMPAPYAAAIVALVNLLLAAVLVAVASRLNAEKEIEPAIEMRDLALTELESDLEGAVDGARDLSRHVGQMARDPLGTALPALIGPLLALLAKGDKK